MLFVMVAYLFLLALPPLCFAVAAIAEIRQSRQKGRSFFVRMGEIAAGFILFVAYYKSPGIMRITSSIPSWTGVSLSLLLGGLSLGSKYESRLALRCVLLGSASLACLWYFKGAISIEARQRDRRIHARSGCTRRKKKAARGRAAFSHVGTDCSEDELAVICAILWSVAAAANAP